MDINKSNKLFCKSEFEFGLEFGFGYGFVQSIGAHHLLVKR